MKITRRGLAGIAAGAAAATQMPQSKANYNYKNSSIQFDAMAKQTNTLAADPHYYKNRIERLKRLLSGDFSDHMYEFENYSHGRIQTNIDSLKSVSSSAKQTFLENAFNKKRKEHLLEQAQKELDGILGLPFNVTGILFK